MDKVHNILEYGPIIASNEELDLFVTVNGAYFNLWYGNGEEAIDCYATSLENGLHGADITKLMDRGKEILEDFRLQHRFEMAELEAMRLDWTNNYLTSEKFSEDYDLTAAEFSALLRVTD